MTNGYNEIQGSGLQGDGRGAGRRRNDAGASGPSGLAVALIAVVLATAAYLAWTGALGGKATLFAAGVISDHRWQYRLTFTPDGRTAYFSVADEFFPGSRQATIYVSELGEDGEWTEPRVAPFSGTYPDIDPFITPDGSRMYFASIRPVDGEPKPDLDIFYMDRVGDGWGEPVRLGPEVNSELDELYPSADSAGVLYFASGPDRPTEAADWDIYFARPTGAGFAPREPLVAVNTSVPFVPGEPTVDWEFNPEISPDGRMLIFTSHRPGGYGYGDLYVTHFRNGAWTEPENLGPRVNTEHDEFHATLSRDGRTLYFVRTVLRPELVPGSFYRIPTRAVPALRRR